MSVHELSHIGLDEHLPEASINALRTAHNNGKPIMLVYDASTKTVNDVTGDYLGKLEKAKKWASERLGGTESSPSSAKLLDHSFSTSSEKPTNFFRTGKGDMHWGKVTGVAAGAVTMGALYLLLTKKNNEKETWAERANSSNSAALSR